MRRQVLPRPCGRSARPGRLGAKAQHRRAAPRRRVHLATLVSIFSQENQYRVIKCHHIHKTNIPRYWER